MKVVLVALMALLWGGPAAAWIHGIPTITMSANMGALDKAGFGGIDLGATPWTLETVVNDDTAASCSSSCDLIVDGWNQLTTRGTYGSAAAWGTPPSGYHVTLNNGVARLIVAVTVVPAASYVRSHYDGTATLANADSTTSFQLKTVLESTSLPLGTTVYMRDGSGDTGTTPALHPHWTYNVLYTVTVPVTGTNANYAAGNGQDITVRSENYTTYADEWGNSVVKGNAEIGQLQVITSACNQSVRIPIKLQYLTFYGNWAATGGGTGTGGSGPGGGGTSQAMLRSSCGYGLPLDHLWVGLGPNVPKEQAIANDISGVLVNRSTVTYSHFERLGVSALTISPGSLGSNNWGSHQTATGPGGTTPWPLCTGTPPNVSCDMLDISDNDFVHLYDDAIELGTNTGEYSVQRNFMHDWDSLTGKPLVSVGDTLTITDTTVGAGSARTYTYVSDVTGGGNADGNIPIDNARPIMNIINTACTINGGGTLTIVPSSQGPGLSSYACVAGVNYPAAATANAYVTAVYDGLDSVTNVYVQMRPKTAGHTITDAVGSALYNKPATLRAGGTAGGYNVIQWVPIHPDSVQYLGATYASLYTFDLINNIVVRNNPGPNYSAAQGLLFTNNSPNLCCLTGMYRNNVMLSNFANQIQLHEWLDGYDLYNTALTDVGSDYYAPTADNYDNIDNPTWYNLNNKAVNDTLCDVGTTGQGGGTFTNSISNYFDVSCNAGTTVSPNPNETLNYGLTGDTQAATVARYQLAFPNYPTLSMTTGGTRAGALATMIPARGQTFTADLSSTCSMTNASADLALGTKINGPGMPNPGTASYDSFVATKSGAGPYSFTFTMTGHLTCVAQSGATFSTGAMNPDGTYNGALFPADDFGDAGWNDGTVFDPTQHHTPAQ